MLHNVYAPLVEAYGWDAAARTDPTLTTGNSVWLHLFIDALTLQPCSPTCKYHASVEAAPYSYCFIVVSARDAWIQADANRYAGANKCLLWKAFASRGLGVGAASYTDSSAVPSECSTST